MTPTKIEALEALQTVEIARILRDMRSPLSVEAANRIASQAATIRQMREALEPFAAENDIDERVPDDQYLEVRLNGIIVHHLHAKDIRAARAALNGGAK